MGVGRRFTKQRKLVLEALRGNPVHPTADEIYHQLKPDHPEISLGTVYRNLNVLCEMGEIIKVEGSFASDRFDGNNSRHYHFVCRHCKELFDLPVGYYAEIDSDVSRASNHDVQAHSILFEGTCETCKRINKG